MTAARMGRIPEGPVTTVLTQPGALVAVALPRPEGSTGFVWRLARRVDRSVVRQVSEADVGESVVAIFEAAAAGSASIVFGLTCGESSPDALRSVVYEVTVE